MSFLVMMHIVKLNISFCMYVYARKFLGVKGKVEEGIINL